MVAVKIINAKKVSMDNTSKNLKREIDILRILHSDYIVKFIQAVRTPNNIYIFFEFCDGGDLLSLLQKRGSKLTESEAILIFR